MNPREKFNKQKLQNDLDPDFDLDEYIDEQSGPEESGTTQEERDNSSYRIKNSLLIVAAITALFLWYFDWSPSNAYSYFFGEEEAPALAEGGGINIQIPPINVEIPEPPEPPIFPELPSTGSGSSSLDMPITDYLVELREQGLLSDDKLSAFEARQLYDGEVPIDYIRQIDDHGWLNHFSFVHITEFYRNDIPFSYLESLEQAGYLFKFSFPAITEYYRNGVTFEYLELLEKTGYLNELSFVYVSEYYKAGVTPEFLDKLKESGLYNDLSFIDVVDLYNRENN